MIQNRWRLLTDGQTLSLKEITDTNMISVLKVLCVYSITVYIQIFISTQNLPLSYDQLTHLNQKSKNQSTFSRSHRRQKTRKKIKDGNIPSIPLARSQIHDFFFFNCDTRTCAHKYIHTHVSKQINAAYSVLKILYAYIYIHTYYMYVCMITNKLRVIPWLSPTPNLKNCPYFFG